MVCEIIFEFLTSRKTMRSCTKEGIVMKVDVLKLIVVLVDPIGVTLLLANRCVMKRQIAITSPFSVTTDAGFIQVVTVL